VRPELTRQEPFAEQATEARPTPVLDSPARPELLQNAEGGSVAQRQLDAASGARPRRKRELMHWETLLRSRSWPDKPSE
jgi:hypothetical protein